MSQSLVLVVMLVRFNYTQWRGLEQKMGPLGDKVADLITPYKPPTLALIPFPMFATKQCMMQVFSACMYIYLIGSLRRRIFH